ncbi:ATP-grasp fold amidoligase family protein [Aeromonas veronii]
MKFLEMLRRRFEGKDTNVPWELDNKLLAYEHVSKFGFKTPQSRSFKDSHAAAEWAINNLKDNFVVKAGDRHSCIGVYLLEKQDNEEYIELLRLKKFNLNDIGRDIVGTQPSYWIAESFVDSYIYGKNIPLDYKFYTFRGVISLVVQIDRNTTPPKVAFFDGNFIPLIYEQDYVLDKSRWTPCGHVLPNNMTAMVSMVSTLSKSVDTDFVSIDCFDSAEGPIFGEFTFAPGAPDAKMVTFSEEIMLKLDCLTQKVKNQALSGLSIDHDSFIQACHEDQNPIYNDLSIYGRIAARMLGQDKKISSYIPENEICLNNRKLNGHVDFILKYTAFLNGDHEQSFTLANRIHSCNAFFIGNQKHAPLIDAAVKFYSDRVSQGPWFATRLEQLKFQYYPLLREESFNKIREISNTGYVYARNVMASLENNYKKSF